jgi:hypothetical protein
MDGTDRDIGIATWRGGGMPIGKFPRETGPLGSTSKIEAVVDLDPDTQNLLIAEGLEAPPLPAQPERVHSAFDYEYHFLNGLASFDLESLLHEAESLEWEGPWLTPEKSEAPKTHLNHEPPRPPELLPRIEPMHKKKQPEGKRNVLHVSGCRARHRRFIRPLFIAGGMRSAQKLGP